MRWLYSSMLLFRLRHVELGNKRQGVAFLLLTCCVRFSPYPRVTVMLPVLSRSCCAYADWACAPVDAQSIQLSCAGRHCSDLERLLCQVDVQDTVGCGDSFAAAVVLGYTRGHAIPPVMALANAVRLFASTTLSLGLDV